MSGSVSDRYKEALQRGHVAVVKGLPHEAVSHYQEAATLAPERPLPYIRIGRVYLQMEQPRDALKAFEAALERSPSERDALEGRAAALAAAGRAQEAGAARSEAAKQADRERASRQQQRRRPADPRLLEIERHIVNGAAARAAGDAGVASVAYLTAANGYVAINDFDAAIDACLRALEAQPGNIDVHFVMAMLYLRRGWTDLGVERMRLIERRLDIDDDRLRRNALAALARDFRGHSAELERLAASTV